MKEKKREEQLKPASGGDGDSIFDVTPEPENKNVSVSCGPYLETLPVAGSTVAQVRRRFKDSLDIDSEALAVINGNDAGEDTVLRAGEALVFIRHAGEKGSGLSVTIEGKIATVANPEGSVAHMGLSKLLSHCSPNIDTGPCILPTGIKAVLSRGPITIWVWERAPAIQKLSWIKADSPQPYGPGTTYRNVRIGLPYLVIFAVFSRANGMPTVAYQDECFFRTEPLKQLSDELSFPGLLNCSKQPPGKPLYPFYPLSWICTQYLRKTPGMTSTDPGQRFAAAFDAVRYCLLETSFNLSSEHHEGNSWYGASKTIDKRIATVEAWEAATKADPLFVLDVPWIPTEHSVAQVAERIFNRLGAVNGAIKSSNDLARIIVNG